MMRRAAVGISILCLVLVGRADAAERPPSALTTIRHVAIQHNGRHKPFDSFAREIITFLTGEARWGREDPVLTVLSILAEPERWEAEPILAVPFVPLREALGLDSKTTHVSYNALIATRALMRRLPAIVEKQQRDETLTMLDNETWDAYQRFVAFSRLVEHDLELVPSVSVASPSWVSVFELEGYPADQQEQLHAAWTSWVAALGQQDPTTLEGPTSRLAAALRGINPSAYPADWRLRWEVTYNRIAPFRFAQLAYFIAVVGIGLGLATRHRWAAAVGTGALWTGFLLHGGGIVLRVILGGRPPVSNFYETMLWLPLVAVALGLIFERVYRVGYIGMAAAALAGCTLLLADAVPLDSSITPVVAVLRSTLWLTVHVLMIVASYGALALAAVLAHLYGALYLVRRGAHPALEAMDTFLYRTIQVGVVLLAGGVMLGAVWANASWGRYWGWDPKETWALITLLWFLAVLHGRFAGWLRGIGVALSTIGGFLLLLMTYYGVSFYLVGLHSYAGGHAKPLPAVLIAYLIAEAGFFLIVGLAALRRRQPV